MTRKILRLTVVTDQIWIRDRSYSCELSEMHPPGPTVPLGLLEPNLQPPPRAWWASWNFVGKLLKGLR